MKALLVFGARPNYMKIAPLYRAITRIPGCSCVLVNTGQHFDRVMAGDFVDALDLPEPDIDLQIGAGSQAQQMAAVMQRLEPVLLAERPHVTVVVGDVSSTLAAALSSSTVGIPVAHVEAGLRSRDWSMPEERNRVLTDRLSTFLFTPSIDADDNLRLEGIDPGTIYRVGNVMIDSLDWLLPRLPRDATARKHGVSDARYALATLHRPSNVDCPEVLEALIRGLEDVGRRLPVLFPVHPRTLRRLEEFEISFDSSLVRTLPALPYPEFISLLAGASLVLTDSGGIQEETMVLGVPCLTLRQNTERPITLEFGMNQLVKPDRSSLTEAAERALGRGLLEPRRPDLWDGRSAERIVEVLLASFASTENREPVVVETVAGLNGASRPTPPVRQAASRSGLAQR